MKNTANQVNNKILAT